METVLSNDEIRRYSRHLIMPEVTLEGQKRLKEASVLCIGVGGLGSPLAIYLTAAGVGRIGLVDFDRVEFSNLQRQILHHTGDVGRSKLESAAEKLMAINPEVEVVTYEEMFTSANAVRICRDYDVVADGTDNFPTRYLANDVCVLLGKPNVYASVFRFEGQASVFHAEKGPCYRCLYPEPPPPGMVPSCAEGGVLGVLPGIMGTIQATEVIKLILGIGEPLIGRLLLFDALEMRSKEMQLQKDPDCPICGEHPTIHELIDYEAFCGLPVGGEEAHAEELGAEWEITPRELQARYEKDSHQPFIVDVRERHEWDICHLPKAHLIPEGDLPARMHELDSADEIVLYCRTGVRSARALKLLREAGFRKLKNLVGGIHEWADEVDSSMPTY
ncbi:molybdopterin-synthase adenylyltransferase MoeB [Candidatus Bathyarchaeota archaeon]|jgi:adenylyltransferase/sulfurtransferase|nr:MAG: molybdopterin-synthase adenylyltransferase MoeB [Candidatus Bathyarchaeota archaeon]